MIRFFLLTLGSHLRGGRTLFLLSVFGVALGVASVLSIQIINMSAMGAFSGSMRAISGNADFSILPRTPTIDERLYPQVLSDPGVEAAWPIHRVDVALAGEPDTFLEVFGVDLFAPVEVPWESAGPTAGAPLTTPGWVSISPDLAETYGWSVGDSFTVHSGTDVVELVVGALVDFKKVSPFASSRMVVMDLAQSQHAFGGRGTLDQIDVRVREGEDAEAVARRVEVALGPTVAARSPEQREALAEGLTRAFRLNITALSLVSLFVGAFLVYTSTQAALVRRRNELGLLRSIGLTRGGVLALIGGEVALLGLLGVTIGIPLGYLAALWNVETVSASISNIYLLSEIEQLKFPWWLAMLAGSIGIGAALASAAVPAIDAGRRATRELLAAYTLHEKTSRWAPTLAGLGLSCVVVATVAGVLLHGSWRPAGFVVGVGLLVGLPLMAPWVVRTFTRKLGLRGFGLLYGIKALGLRLQTTSFAVASLAVAVSMLIGITLMIGSFRRTVDVWIQSTLHADVYVTSESWRRARGDAVLDSELANRIASAEGVATVDRLRQVFAYVDDESDRRITLSAVDMTLPVEPRFTMFAGDLDDARRRCVEEGAVIITEPLSRRFGLKVGDALAVTGPQGPVVFPVAGISYDYSNEAGGAMTDHGAMRRHFGPGESQSLALYLEPGVDVQRFVDGLRARYVDVPFRFRSNRDLRTEVFEIFDQTFAVTRLLQAMSLLIAACGITLTLVVLARERVSELALYRALGAARRQIFAVFLGKGVGIAVFGIVLGAVGGLALAFVLIYMINRAYFGWTIALHWPLRALAEQLVTIVIAAVLASVYPALRASRTPAAELSREDL